MASEEKNYSPEFKKEVAQKALDQSKRNLDGLSREYDVPVSVILMWATELEKGSPEVFESAEETEDVAQPEQPSDVDLEITDGEIIEGYEYGVMKDRLNYRRLIFWSILGIILTHIFVQALMEMNSYNERVTRERQASEQEYSEADRIQEQAKEHINSFGVNDLEGNIYRIPIDSAINDIAVDTQN